MITALLIGLYIFMLAAFLGYQVISKVPQLLHTPLMAFTNAISGISLVASIVIAGASETVVTTILGTVAVAAASINVIGGFIITDRMLKMFKKKGAPPSAPAGAAKS
ncbi:MAG TPA: NAD(P) transhydrogenase subunit alpha [Planctomycetota bacterium]|nr:NAD(P) transhydrogenase subunit alpha [Planctomycetota bacterium]